MDVMLAQQFEMTEQLELRNQYIERIEVLDKVKQLFLIPENGSYDYQDGSGVF